MIPVAFHMVEMLSRCHILQNLQDDREVYGRTDMFIKLCNVLFHYEKQVTLLWVVWLFITTHYDIGGNISASFGTQTIGFLKNCDLMWFNNLSYLAKHTYAAFSLASHPKLRINNICNKEAYFISQNFHPFANNKDVHPLRLCCKIGTPIFL